MVPGICVIPMEFPMDLPWFPRGDSPNPITLGDPFRHQVFHLVPFGIRRMQSPGQRAVESSMHHGVDPNKPFEEQTQAICVLLKAKGVCCRQDLPSIQTCKEYGRCPCWVSCLQCDAQLVRVDDHQFCSPSSIFLETWDTQKYNAIHPVQKQFQ